MRDILYTARFDRFRLCVWNFAYTAHTQLRAFISSPADHSSAPLHKLPAAGTESQPWAVPRRVTQVSGPTTRGYYYYYYYW